MPNEFTESTQKDKVLILSYLTALLAGYAFPLAGILSPQIAESLNVKVSNIVFIDGVFMIGLTIGSFCIGAVLSKLATEKTIKFTALLLLFVNLGFALQNNIFIYLILVFLNGLFLGSLVSSINYFIISTFEKEGNESDSKLNIMQFFVGIGCFVGAATVGYIVFYTSWRYAFALVSVLYLLIALSFILIRTEVSDKMSKSELFNERKSIEKNGISLPLFIIMISLALISCVYTEYIISYWFSPYMQLDKNVNIKTVGLIISIFWLTLAFGRLIIGKFILPYISDFKLIVILSLITITGFLIFIFSNNTAMFFVSIFILGIGCSAIYPTLIAYGMKLSESVSAYILSFLVMCGFFGGFLSLICSAALGAFLPKIIPILTGPLWALLIIIFFISANRIKMKTKN